MEVRLDGRAVLVTGGSTGLGLAIAVRMAASGADVAMLARRADVLEEARATVAATARGRVHVVPCDVSRADEVTRAHEEVVRTLGRVDILVNNAGTSQVGAFASVTDEVWQADLDLKLFAAIRLARLAWPGMAERRWGRIINVLKSLLHNRLRERRDGVFWCASVLTGWATRDSIAALPRHGSSDGAPFSEAGTTPGLPASG